MSEKYETRSEDFILNRGLSRENMRHMVAFYRRRKQRDWGRKENIRSLNIPRWMCIEPYTG